MSIFTSPQHLHDLVAELINLPAETEWLEFKINNDDPAMIGRSASAISNAAALHGRACGYIIWGVADESHAIVGTQFRPGNAKKGNQDLTHWLSKLLDPHINIHFHAITFADKPVVILEIASATACPTRFEGTDYIRISSVNQSLREFPNVEAALWKCFDKQPFEQRVARIALGESEVLDYLDYPAYFALLKQPLPSDRISILKKLAEDQLVVADDSSRWSITNLGALLFAKKIEAFPHLARKAVRLIVYDGDSRIKTLREQIGVFGYANGFQGLVRSLTDLLPRNEVIGQALRSEVAMFPDLAVRELLANALIHQDLSITGSGPMVEVFASRLEITNPGIPLMDINRMLDHAPRSRNEALAAFMRRIGVCEERGSGIDKVVHETETYQLPPPRWEAQQEALKVTLYAHKELRGMDRKERVHACYLHACLRYVMDDPMTNASLRERFRIEEKNAAMASRIIRDALEDGFIQPYDDAQAKRNSRYLPFWARV